jgi:hypothetical protein
MPGIWELAIIAPVALALLLLVLAFTRSRPRLLLLRLFEWRVRAKLSQERAGDSLSEARRVILRAAAAAATILAMAAFTASLASGSPLNIALELISTFGPVLAIVAAVVIHFRPNTRRTQKYFLLLAAIGTHAGLVGARAFAGLKLGTAVNLAVGAAPSLLLVTFAIGVVPWLRSWPRAWQVYQATRLSIPIVLGLAFAPYAAALLAQLGSWFPALSSLLFALLLAVLILRFLSAARMAANPILFFRAFGNLQTGRTVGRLVAPAASRLGVVRTLVHPVQRGSRVAATTSILESPQFDQVPDDTWKLHVHHLLERCAAVILDLTAEGASLAWECEEALNTVGASNVLLLLPPGTPATAPSEVATLAIPNDAGMGDARSALRLWLKAAVERRAAR